MSEAKFMVDRVAEAIARVAVKQKVPDFHAMAVAAIEAMREPTEGMQRAWIAANLEGDPDEMEPENFSGQGDHRTVPKWQNIWFAFDCEKRHRAMIDAALSEK